LHRPPARIRGRLAEHGREAIVIAQVGRSFGRGGTRETDGPPLTSWEGGSR
jgi:hypothetical protein